jgi:CBS domain containing-hemolysin-like protein
MPVHMALVVDEYGYLRGVVTQTDLLEAIAGDLADPEGVSDTSVDMSRRWFVRV